MKMDVLRYVACIASASQAFRSILVEVNASSIIQACYPPMLENPPSSKNDFVSLIGLSLALLEQHHFSLTSVDTDLAEECGTGPTALLRRYCAAILAFHWGKGKCDGSFPVTEKAPDELFDMIRGNCAHCNERLTVPDEPDLLGKLVQYIRFVPS